MNTTSLTNSFIGYNSLKHLAGRPGPSVARVRELIHKVLELKGLSLEESAELVNLKEPESMSLLLDTAGQVKDAIYGRRMVLFAPVYTGNICSNNCLYCGFRKDNTDLRRISLSPEEIDRDVTGHRIRRVNVEIAPMSVDEFRLLKDEKIRKRCGLHSFSNYTSLKDSRADRYLMRFETSDPELRRFLRDGYTLDERLEELLALKDTGFEAGPGYMTGLPGETE